MQLNTSSVHAKFYDYEIYTHTNNKITGLLLQLFFKHRHSSQFFFIFFQEVCDKENRDFKLRKNFKFS